MTGQHLSLTTLSVILTVTGVLLYGAIVLYGAQVDGQPDGRRHRLRDKGLHPGTDNTGEVHAHEEETDDGDRRS